MTEKQMNLVQLNDIFFQISAKNKVVTLEHCQAVWESFIKAIVSHADPKKSILIFDMFYITTKIVKNFNTYEWIPTLSLIQKCQLLYGLDIPQLNMTLIITKQKLARIFNKQQCLKSLGDSQEAGWSILQHIFKQIRQQLMNQNVQINLQFFGELKVHNRQFYHHVKQDKHVRIKKLMSSRKNSKLRISRRDSQILSFQRQDTSENVSYEDLSVNQAKKKLNPLISPLAKTNSVFNLNINQPNWLSPKQRSFMNNFASPDARISNDLLGAGIDPLKYDYNYSKLVNQTNKLFNKTFTRPKPAKIRHPGIIDKFERTTGVPQTGLKVSNSVIVRIGSNYNQHSKYIYTDIKSKNILLVPRQPKITFTQNQQQKLLCATEEEQYYFVVTGDIELQKKVEQRLNNYKRYVKYIQQYIQNTNVSPIPKQSIIAIVNLVKAVTPNYKDPVNVAIMDHVMNQANREYYRAYKKSMLDYILIDDKEKERTGIHIIFKPPIQWGQRKINMLSPLHICKIDKNVKSKAAKMLVQHLFHPKCVLQISELNLKMKDIDLFRIKNQDNKPVNVLYFIKKQNTHISDIMAYLGSDWIKLVGDIVQKHLDFENEPEKKTTTFLRLINVMLSNTLKNIVYQSFDKLAKFFLRFSKNFQCDQSPILQISIIDQNGKFVLSDDFRKILTDEIKNLIQIILEESKKIHGIQFYLKDVSNSYLWKKQKNQNYYEQIIQKITKVIDENCEQIDKFKKDFDKFSVILKYQQETIQWLKTSRTLAQIDERNLQIKKLQDLIETIPYCYINKMILIECFDEKQKLKGYLNNLKSQLYQNLDSTVKKSNLKSFGEIQQIKRNISMPIQNTADYLKVSSDLEQIKKKRLNQLSVQMEQNKKSLLKLHELGYGFVYSDVIYKIYKTNLAFKSLNSKIDYHEDRIGRQKIQLQTMLKDKIKFFESNTITQLATISARIDQFELRRVYNDYLVEMNNFKRIVEDNDQTIVQLNRQQQNLKWPKSLFKAAEQLKNIVIPNYQLWNLVLEYDCMIKQWKNKQICQMDAAQVKRRVQQINFRVSRAIKKLKNLSSLKIAYQLQKDTKDVLAQQVQIIQIFSHPGLKQRHWQLFNTKLMIPGVDLKQIPYSKIKIFEQYQKNLKVFAVISTQAAKQFEIQTQRNSQQQYWLSISFETYSNKMENTFCISQFFLSNCLSLLQQHINKLSVMKNYLYSKALYQQLQQWQLWLSSCKKNLQNLRTIQSQLNILRPLFSLQQMARQLPIQNSQFQSIDNCWKTLTKKIWQHSKLSQFLKSPKVSQMIQEVVKKIQLVKKGIPIFLMTKRSEFPRFYFVDDKKLTSILVKGAYSATQKQALQLGFSHSFAENLQLIQNDQKYISIKSETDRLNFTSNLYQGKLKKKLSQNLTFLERCMKLSIKNQISELPQQIFSEDIRKLIQKYSLASIFCKLNLKFKKQLQKSISQNKLISLSEMKNKMIRDVAILMKEEKSNIQSQKDSFAIINKHIIKLSKIILSFIGQIQKIQSFRKIENINLSSFQYLSLLKFSLKHSETQIQNRKQSSKNISQISNNKIIKEKIDQMCKPSTNNRRSSQLNNNSINNFHIQIEIMNKRLQYRQQFWGDQIHNYLPSFTQQTVFNIVNTIISNKVSSLSFKKSSTIIRKLAILCGQHHVELSQNYFSQQEGFSCILRGIISSHSWIMLDYERLKLNQRNIGKISRVAAEIRQKQYQLPANRSFGQKMSTFMKTINQVIDVSFGSACFLSLNNQNRFQQISKSLRNEMRSVSLVIPPFMEYIKKQTNQQFIKFVKQNQQSSLKDSIFELTAFYQKPEKVKYQTVNLLKRINLQQNKDRPSLKQLLFSEFVSDQFQIVKNGQMLKSQLFSQNIQTNSMTSSTPHNQTAQNKSSSKQGLSISIHHPSLNMQNMNKDKISYKQIYSKAKSQLIQQLQISNIVVLYGSLDVKTQLVMDVIKQIPGYNRIDRSLYSFSACTFQNVDSHKFMEKICQNLVIQLNKILQNKQYKKQMREGRRDLYLHIQHLFTLEQAFALKILKAAQNIQNKGIIFDQTANKTDISIKLIFDCIELSHISPSTSLILGKIHLQIPENLSIGQFYCDWLTQNIKIDKQRSEDSRVNYQSVMYTLKTMQQIFQNVVSMSLKALSAKLNCSAIHKKYLLTLRFLRMFKIYIDHLDDKEVDQYIDFDVSSYIKNSFLYCVYWTICVGFLQPHQHFIVQQALLKQHFPQTTEIQQISKYMLNEQNEWLSWESLKQQFVLTDVKNIPIYNVWVSTQQNMKIYTNVIKLLEKGLKIIVVGEKCSGKSILLKEISNFEMSYTSFLIDCHRLSRAEEVGQVIKNRIFYTKTQKKLILIDDISLPLQQIKITQIVKKLLEQNILTCRFQYSSPFYQNKNLTSQMSALITCSNQIDTDKQNLVSLHMLENKAQRLNMRSYQQSDISTIYGSYIAFQLDKLKLKFNQKITDFDTIFTSFICKIYKKFHLDFHTSNKIVKLFFTRLAIWAGPQKKQEQVSENNGKSISIIEMLHFLNSSIFAILENKPNFQAVTNLCFEETNKILNTNSFKHVEQFSQKVQHIKYNNLPTSLTQLKTNSSLIYFNASDRSLRERIQSVGNLLQDFAQQKDEGIRFIPTSIQTQIIFKLLSLLKICPSHILILSQTSSINQKQHQNQSKWIQTSGFGIRTLVKIVSYLMSLQFNQLENQAIKNFVNDSLNVIKVGGKVDECICYLSKNQFKNISQQVNSQFLPIVNSFISSPQLHQFFTQQRIQQVFVKFSSEKKTLKRSEFIKKVREKINLLFHFVISVDADGLNYLKVNYPNLTKQCHLITVHKMPEQSLYEIANKVIKSDNTNSKKIKEIANSQQDKYRRSITNSLVQIYNKFQSLIKTRFKQNNPNYTIKYKIKNIYEYFQIFKTLRKKYEDLNKRQQMNSQVWVNRRKETQQKYEQLIAQKTKLMKQNQNYFKTSAIYSSEIQQAQLKASKISEQVRQIQLQRNMLQDKIRTMKLHNISEYQTMCQYQQIVTLQQKMDTFKHQQFEHLYENNKFQKIMKILIGGDIRQTVDLDFKTNILEALQKLRQWKKTKVDFLVEQLINKLNTDNIEDGNYIQVEYCFKQWLLQFKKLVQKMKVEDNQIIQQQHILTATDVKLKIIQSQQKRAQGAVENYKQKLKTQFPDSSKMISNYQQICRSISQTEPILNIFKHFQKVIKSNNKQRDKQTEPVPLNKSLSCLIMAAAYIQFSFYITDENDSQKFFKQAKQIIKSNGLQIDDKNIFDSILNSQQRFKNKYGLIQNKDSQTLCQIGLNCNTCSVIKVNDNEVQNFYEWLKLTTERTVKIIQNNEIGQVNQCMLNGYIGLIVNANSMMIKKLKPLIINDVQVKNNTVYINITEQTILNSMTRIIFVFTPSHIKQQKIHELGLSNLWHLSFPTLKLTQQYKQYKIKSILMKNKCRRIQLIQQHLQLFQQLSKIDKKIQKMIMTIRKNSEDPDSIIIKIQGISEQKQKTLVRMEQIVQQLDRIDNKQKNGNTVPNESDDRQMKQIKQIKQIIEISSRLNTVSKFNAFIKYLQHVNSKQVCSIGKIKYKCQIYVNLFSISRLGQNKSKPMQQNIKFMKINQQQKCITNKIQQILSKSPDQSIQANISNLWHKYLQTILTTKCQPQTTVNKIKQDQSPSPSPSPSVSVSVSIPVSLSCPSSLNNTRKQTKNVLIYRTDYVEMMQKYMIKTLVQHGQHINQKQVNSLGYYNITNGSQDTFINIVMVKNYKQWKSISSYLNIQQQKENKNNNNNTNSNSGNQKLIILCGKHISIPAHLEYKVFAIDGHCQAVELTDIIAKINNIQPHINTYNIVTQIDKQLKQKCNCKIKGNQDSCIVNQQQVVQQIININGHNHIQVSEQCKYLATVFVQ